MSERIARGTPSFLDAYQDLPIPLRTPEQKARLASIMYNFKTADDAAGESMMDTTILPPPHVNGHKAPLWQRDPEGTRVIDIARPTRTRLDVVLAVIAVLAAVMGLCVALTAYAGCSGTQPASPTAWVPTAENIVSDLGIELPGIEQAVQAVPGVDPAAKLTAEQALIATGASIPGLNTALANYAASPTGNTMCLVRSAMQLVAQALIAVGDGLLAIGLDTPAIILTSLGELGSMIDGFVTCTPGDAGPSMHSIIQTHFAHRPAFLRPFPAVSSGSPSPAPQ